jgi:hypothetical protein
MAIAGIGEMQGWNEIFIARYQGIEGVLVHQVSRALQLRAGQIRAIDKKIPDPLSVHFSGPLCPKQSGRGQMHEKIPQLGRIEDICDPALERSTVS